MIAKRRRAETTKGIVGAGSRRGEPRIRQAGADAIIAAATLGIGLAPGEASAYRRA